MKIRFSYHEVSPPLRQVAHTKAWLVEAAGFHNHTTGSLHYIFVRDEYLLEMNRNYLQHDYYTDIITFDMGVPGQAGVWGEIYISVDRVRDNAKELGVPFSNEMHRVLVHGLLHLIGFPDKTPAQAKRMRHEEEKMMQLME